jgi:pantetheine-phosphate adenylyltransferase
MIEREMDRDVRPLLASDQEIIVTSYEGLTVDFMEKVKSSFCVRGLRGIKDLEEEADLASVNRDLFADTLNEAGMENFSQAYFATSRPELRHVSSSFARAICATGQKDLSLLKYVSADVAAKMIAKREDNAKKFISPS